MTIREGDIKIKVWYKPKWMSLLMTRNGKILINLWPFDVVCKVKEKKGIFGLYKTVCTLKYSSDKKLDNSRFTLFNINNNVYTFSHTNKNIDAIKYNCKLCFMATKNGLAFNTSSDRKKSIKEFNSYKVRKRRKRILSKILN